MREIMKSVMHSSRLCIGLLALCCQLVAVARDFQYNGLNYTVVDEYYKECKLSEGDMMGPLGVNTPTGAVVIPAQASDGQNTYTVISIGRWSFAGSKTLTAVTIPNTVEQIEDGAFQNCWNLESAKIGESVTSIGNEAFSGCYALKEITIPDEVTTLGLLAFADCERLNKLTIGSALKTVGYAAFYNCIGIDDLILNCKNVGQWFEDCKGIETIIADDMVETIATGTFKGCAALKEVYFGNSMTTIMGEAFADCDGITVVDCMTRIPPTIYESTFSEACYKNAALRVRMSSEPAYRKAQYWSRFFEDAGVDDVTADGTDKTFTVTDGAIHNVAGAEISVYGVNGTLEYSGNGRIIPLSEGIYVVVAEGESHKVVIR